MVTALPAMSKIPEDLVKLVQRVPQNGSRSSSEFNGRQADLEGLQCYVCIYVVRMQMLLLLLVAVERIDWIYRVTTSSSRLH